MYILSTGRCGTNYLAHIISNDISQIHQDYSSRYLNILGNLSLNSNLFRKILTSKMDKLKVQNRLPYTVDPLKSISYYISLNF